MKQLNHILEEDRLTVNAPEEYRDTIKTYLEQSEVALGYTDKPISQLQADILEGSTIREPLIELRPVNREDSPLYIAGGPTDEDMYLHEGQVGFAEELNDTLYRVTIGYEPVIKEHKPETQNREWHCGPNGPMPGSPLEYREE